MTESTSMIQSGRCGQCGYATAGLPTLICPECGSDMREAGILTNAVRRTRLSLLGILLWLAVGIGGYAAIVSVVLEHVWPWERQYNVDHHLGQTPPLTLLVRGNFEHRSIHPRVVSQSRRPRTEKLSFVDEATGEVEFLIEPRSRTFRYRDAKLDALTDDRPLCRSAFEQWASVRGLDLDSPDIRCELNFLWGALQAAELWWLGSGLESPVLVPVTTENGEDVGLWGHYDRGGARGWGPFRPPLAIGEVGSVALWLLIMVALYRRVFRSAAMKAGEGIRSVCGECGEEVGTAAGINCGGCSRDLRVVGIRVRARDAFGRHIRSLLAWSLAIIILSAVVTPRIHRTLVPQQTQVCMEQIVAGPVSGKYDRVTFRGNGEYYQWPPSRDEKKIELDTLVVTVDPQTNDADSRSLHVDLSDRSYFFADGAGEILRFRTPLEEEAFTAWFASHGIDVSQRLVELEVEQLWGVVVAIMDQKPRHAVPSPNSDIEVVPAWPHIYGFTAQSGDLATNLNWKSLTPWWYAPAVVGTWLAVWWVGVYSLNRRCDRVPLRKAR